MERFLSRSTVLVFVIVMGMLLAVPIAGQLVFGDMLPERWQFKHWPPWIQIPSGVTIALYLVTDVWLTVRPPRKPEEDRQSSSPRHNAHP